MNYNLHWVMEHLGTEATREDAEAAFQNAEDWYNTAGTTTVLAWYADYQCSNPHAETITDEDDGSLVNNWIEIIVFHRAIHRALAVA